MEYAAHNCEGGSDNSLMFRPGKQHVLGQRTCMCLLHTCTGGEYIIILFVKNLQAYILVQYVYSAVYWSVFNVTSLVVDDTCLSKYRLMVQGENRRFRKCKDICIVLQYNVVYTLHSICIVSCFSFRVCEIRGLRKCTNSENKRNFTSPSRYGSITLYGEFDLFPLKCTLQMESAVTLHSPQHQICFQF